MRVSIDNGNGMKCDRCGKLVLPKSQDMVKCMCVSPDEDAKRASTGAMKAIGTADLCRKCYEEVIAKYVHEPRRRMKDGEI